MDQPFELQKQISETGEASVPIEPQEIKDSDSARSIISKLSEDNEAEHADLNALKKWLAKSKQQLAKFFTTQTLSDSSKSDSKVQGPYKTKRSVQLLHTQQHHAKLSWDWTLKMQNKGYSDLGNFFSWYKFLERKQAPNPSPKPPRETQLRIMILAHRLKVNQLMMTIQSLFCQTHLLRMRRTTLELYLNFTLYNSQDW